MLAAIGPKVMGLQNHLVFVLSFHYSISLHHIKNLLGHMHHFRVMYRTSGLYSQCSIIPLFNQCVPYSELSLCQGHRVTFMLWNTVKIITINHHHWSRSEVSTVCAVRLSLWVAGARLSLPVRYCHCNTPNELLSAECTAQWNVSWRVHKLQKTTAF